MNKLLLTSILFFHCYTYTADQTVGLFTQTDKSYNGYTLFSPLVSKTTYLINNCGKQVHSWTSKYNPGNSVYLLEDGTLLRTGNTMNQAFDNTGGSGGIIEWLDWEGKVLWSYPISDNTFLQHHDVAYLPNGNILAIVWEKISGADAIAAGRNPTTVGDELWSERIVELATVGTDSASVVWEWRVWDHLVQEYDNAKENYGTVSEHPELINLNMVQGKQVIADWLHINSVTYNPELNQIMMSVHNFSEIWIIDHSTTKTEAASHTGGTYGKGGDLLYRWGNPKCYNSGSVSDQKFFAQHDATWITTGADSGNIMVYNNGMNRPEGNYSSVDVISPPIKADGSYNLSVGQAFGPASQTWVYTSPNKTDFYSASISGASRLANGNTLVCEGQEGRFFEIDGDGTIVWEYVNPVSRTGAVSQGTVMGGTPPNGNPNPVFRCYRYAPDFPGFAGKNLTAGDPIELNPLDYACDVTAIGPGTCPGVNFEVYPNPSNGNFTLLLPDTDSWELSVYDVSGKLMKQSAGSRVSKTKLFMEREGIYFLSVNAGKISYHKKLQVVH
ncbi:MAG: aryl-sulfate sulfotransferase [Fibrobacteria bacterium]|nr:aryl-sulfate sulfotransferase [Fibrobacteria bacterium]